MHYLIGKKITLLVIALMFVMGFFSVKVSSVYAEETAEPVATPSEVAIVAPSESTPVEVITVAETPAPVEAVTPVAEINNVSESVGTPIANTGVVTSEDTTR
ncbi:MAG: hypothetical protein NTV48_01055, partial [Candidatus Vogelbacteria bacterium]|nr:hypothetical protein [Candidatus Vogelbacteria bacterium]